MTKPMISNSEGEVRLSQGAFDLLFLLGELEDAGLIGRGDSVIARNGYDEGTIEVEIPATVTPLGRRVLDTGCNPKTP